MEGLWLAHRIDHSPTEEPMPQSQAAELVQRAKPLPESPSLHKTAGSALLSVSGLAAAAVEGVCAALVLLKSTAIFSGLAGLSAAGASSWFHQDALRIPLMVFAAGAALANLYVIWNGRRLRRSPAAAWRVRLQAPAEKRRTRLLVATSLVTLLLIAGEIYGHYILHAG